MLCSAGNLQNFFLLRKHGALHTRVAGGDVAAHHQLAVLQQHGNAAFGGGNVHHLSVSDVVFYRDEAVSAVAVVNFQSAEAVGGVAQPQSAVGKTSNDLGAGEFHLRHVRPVAQLTNVAGARLVVAPYVDGAVLHDYRRNLIAAHQLRHVVYVYGAVDKLVGHIYYLRRAGQRTSRAVLRAVVFAPAHHLSFGGDGYGVVVARRGKRHFFALQFLRQLRKVHVVCRVQHVGVAPHVQVVVVIHPYGKEGVAGNAFDVVCQRLGHLHKPVAGAEVGVVAFGIGQVHGQHKRPDEGNDEHKHHYHQRRYRKRLAEKAFYRLLEGAFYRLDAHGVLHGKGKLLACAHKGALCPTPHRFARLGKGCAHCGEKAFFGLRLLRLLLFLLSLLLRRLLRCLLYFGGANGIVTNIFFLHLSPPPYLETLIRGSITPYSKSMIRLPNRPTST